MAAPDLLENVQELTLGELGRRLQTAQNQITMHRERAYKAVLQAQQRGSGQRWAMLEIQQLRRAEDVHAELLSVLTHKCRPYQVDTMEGITQDPQGQALVQAILDRQLQHEQAWAPAEQALIPYRLPYIEGTKGLRHGYDVHGSIQWTRSANHPPDPRCPECKP